MLKPGFLIFMRKIIPSSEIRYRPQTYSQVQLLGNKQYSFSYIVEELLIKL